MPKVGIYKRGDWTLKINKETPTVASLYFLNGTINYAYVSMIPHESLDSVFDRAIADYKYWEAQEAEMGL